MSEPDVEVTGGSVSAGGSNSVAVNNPTVLQYPKPPPDTTGEYIALGSIAASFIEQLLSSPDKTLLNSSNDAESRWKAYLGDPSDTSADPTLHGLVKKLNEVSDSIWTTAEDIENTYLEEMRCLLHEMYTNHYQADYQGNYERAIEDMNKLLATKEAEMCRTSSLQQTHLNQSTRVGIQHAAVKAVVGVVSFINSSDFEQQRKVNAEARFGAVDSAEKVTLADKKLALDHFRVAGESLTSLMQNYAWLTTAYRKAAKDKGNAEGAIAGGLLDLILAAVALSDPLSIPTASEKGCEAA